MPGQRQASVSEKLGALSYILFFSGGLWGWLLYFSLLYYCGWYLLYILVGPGPFGPRAAYEGTFPGALRGLGNWKKCAQYCPMTLVKTADLDPDKTYLFGFHPHGVISLSAFITFATEALEFSRVFPGITPHMLTLVQNFYVPFMREFLLLHGVCNCARRTCLTLLSKGSGNAIVLCVGGAREALLAEPGTFEIVLGKRLGFVRVAVQTGASLVPVLSFGENNLFATYRPDRASRLAKVQSWLLRVVGLGFPVIRGTGLFNARIGLLPKQGPIRVVVGKPVEVPRLPPGIDVRSKEGQKVVLEAHAKYCVALRHIWHTYKDRFAMERTGTMRIL
ncbi:hypothetical protein WJX81_006629 [Elliptochloris bilobata]|uniref:Acyltransferase n=1 Tax=Elliptochloris bilobata TaxID=381761 RepID=A0AAW1SIW1_9CHLO